MNWSKILDTVRSYISKWAVVGLAFLSVGSIFFIPTDYLLSILGWIEHLGTMWGTIALLSVYVVTVVLFLPGFTLTIFSGYWCGLFVGTLLSWVGAMLGAVSCFLLGRWACAGLVKRWTAQYPLFHAITNAISRTDGWKMVLLLRLSPLTPFTLVNYLLSATRIRFVTYFYSTLIGMLPPTALFCYLGTAARNLTDIVAARSGGEKTPAAGETSVVEETSARIFTIGLIITVAVTVLITVISSRAIQSELKAMRSKREQEAYLDEDSEELQESPQLPKAPSSHSGSSSPLLVVQPFLLTDSVTSVPGGDSPHPALATGPVGEDFEKFASRLPQGRSSSFGLFGSHSSSFFSARTTRSELVSYV